jgi:hypothetical protein
VLAAGFAYVVDAADVRMRDLPREPNFPMEACQPIGVVCDFAWQELERHGLSKLHVFSSIDLAHAAAAEQVDDAIAARQHRAWNKLRTVERVP